MYDAVCVCELHLTMYLPFTSSHVCSAPRLTPPVFLAGQRQKSTMLQAPPTPAPRSQVLITLQSRKLWGANRTCRDVHCSRNYSKKWKRKQAKHGRHFPFNFGFPSPAVLLFKICFFSATTPATCGTQPLQCDAIHQKESGMPDILRSIAGG